MPSIFKNHHHYAYSKMDTEDPEDKIHRRAQFMIYKTLQEAPTSHTRKVHTNKKKKSSPSSYIGIKLCNFRVKIGKKLKKLRNSLCFNVSVLKIGVCRQVVVQLKTLKKLMSGKEIVSASASALYRSMLSP